MSLLQRCTWSARDVPDQTGRTALVTGATSGLGLATSLALAGAGARVLLTARSAARGQAALDRLRREVPARARSSCTWTSPRWRPCATRRPTSPGASRPWTCSSATRV